MVKSLSDLYYLNQAELATLLNSERIAGKVYMAIMAKSELELAVFLDGLGIDGLGTTTSKQVAKQFKTLAAVRNAIESDFLQLSKVGFTTAQKIVNGMSIMSTTIDGLLKCIDVKDVVDVGGPLKGMSFCITGALSKQRNLVEKDIEAAGGECKSSVGKGLTYLVTNDKTSGSSKNVKAQKMGVVIIDEAELYKMIGGQS